MADPRFTDSPLDLERSARDELVEGSQNLKMVLPDSSLDLEPVAPRHANRMAVNRELQVQSEMLVEHDARHVFVRKPR